MNKSHPKFEEFVKNLEKACDFQEIEGGKDFTWNCDHDHRRCRELLSKYEDIDADKSIKYFEKNGGFCDCEIVFNVH